MLFGNASIDRVHPFDEINDRTALAILEMAWEEMKVFVIVENSFIFVIQLTLLINVACVIVCVCLCVARVTCTHFKYEPNFIAFSRNLFAIDAMEAQ